MNPDLSSWLGQVPWIPLGVTAAAVVLWLAASAGGKKKTASLSAKLAAGAYVIDVRTKAEFSGGHYPGAANIPVDALEKHTKKLGAPDRPIVVYCASGARSSRAAAILKAAGFTDVTNAGGLAAMPR